MVVTRDTSTASSSAPVLQSVSIALDVLEELAGAPELSLSELARRVGVAKSTAHRTCGVLQQRGLLERTAGGGYRLGLRLAEYGQIAVNQSPVKDRALPLLVELRNTLGETVQVGIPAGADVFYVERVEGVRALRYALGNSRRAPWHRSSAGKALAAFHPDMVRARLKAGLPASTGYTIVVPDLLLTELAKIRERGFARSVDETEIGMASIAVPVRVGTDVVAAISSVGPTSRIVGDGERRIVLALQASARKLASAITTGEFHVTPSG